MSKAVIYIDCTNTVSKGKNAGIERVVKNIIDRASYLGKVFSCEFVPLIAIGENFFRVNIDRYYKRKWSKVAFDTLGRLRNALDALCGRHVRGTMSVDILEESADSAHSTIVKAARYVIPGILGLCFEFDGIIESRRVVKLGRDDILFLPDSIFDRNLIESLKSLDKDCPKLIPFIHDIIAFRQEGVFEESLCRNFKIAFELIMPKAQSVICATKTVVDDILDYTNGAYTNISFDYSYLGANLSSRGAVKGEVRSELKTIWNKGTSFLMVGTIEPRKNHIHVLDAFEVLWKRGNNTRLCIVGRIGWLCELILERIRNNPNLNRNLYFFTDLNDNELAFCYERSKALIFASISEGFGLPLVEAMHFGKPVLASDIPVFREIGGDYPFYFSLDNPITLTNLIEDFERGTLEKHFTPRSWISWDEAIFNLMSKVVGKVATGSCPQQP